MPAIVHIGAAADARSAADRVSSSPRAGSNGVTITLCILLGLVPLAAGLLMVLGIPRNAAGMAVLETDSAGNCVGSSYLWASTGDWRVWAN